MKNMITLVKEGRENGLAIETCFFPRWMQWSRLEIPHWARWIGLSVAVVSLTLVVWIHHTLGRFYSASLEIREGHEIVAIGPYSRVRLPMHTVLYAFSLSLGLVAVSILLLFFSAILICPLYLIAIKEEQMLLDRFGDEYRHYMRRTGRLIPK